MTILTPYRLIAFVQTTLWKDGYDLYGDKKGFSRGIANQMS